MEVPDLSRSFFVALYLPPQQWGRVWARTSLKGDSHIKSERKKNLRMKKEMGRDLKEEISRKWRDLCIDE